MKVESVSPKVVYPLLGAVENTPKPGVKFEAAVASLTIASSSFCKSVWSTAFCVTVVCKLVSSVVEGVELLLVFLHDIIRNKKNKPTMVVLKTIFFIFFFFSVNNNFIKN
jgi:hypothetical protein